MRLFWWVAATAVMGVLAYHFQGRAEGILVEYWVTTGVLIAIVTAAFWSPHALERIINPKHGDSRHIFTFFVLFAFACMAVIFVIGLHAMWEDKNLGTFGDFLGGTLNPVLTFLSFMALLFTIVLQQREIQSAHADADTLKNDRIDDRKRAEVQQFEATFFQMLNYHNSIVNSIDLHRGSTKPPLVGRECFKAFHDQLRTRYNELPTISEPQRGMDAYGLIWEKFQKDLAHYFRFLYNIVRFINQSKMPKIKYMRIVRAQLSDFEMAILFYNGLTDTGKKFKEYIEFFTIFDNFDEKLLLNEVHKAYYEDSAFDETAQKAPLSFSDAEPID